MKTTKISRKPDADTAILAFDVSKDRLNLVGSFREQFLEREFANRTAVVEAQLALLAEKFRKDGCRKILVVAEPTGCYHRVLMDAARRLGLNTAWVSGEAVYKMRAIETNDSNKTDLKDPYVIHSLASMGKTLIHRVVDEPYRLLREWNRLYDEADSRVVEIKGAIHRHLKALFPDFDLTRDFLFGPSGHALLRLYGANPYKITEAGFPRFCRRMRKEAPRIRTASLQRLFHQARSSAQNQLGDRHRDLLEYRLRQSWRDLHIHGSRKETARQAMEELYEEVRAIDPHLPPATQGVITRFHLARLVAETGPLSDFSHWRKLMRFCGLNLRERQSGTYRGKTKVAKKGNSLVRKILSQVVLPLVKKTALFGPYYHKKKERMPGTKAMTVVMRKFLKMLYGWYRSGGVFQRSRIFACESQYQMAA